MNTSRLGWLLVAGVIGFGAGCATKDDASRGEDPKEDEFAVLPVDQLSSVLPAIEDSEGRPDICVGMIGFTPSEAKTKLEELELQLTDAMNQWNALLAGNPLWHFKGRIAPNYMMQSTECTQTIYTGFSVNLWKDVARFRSDYCAKNFVPDSRCASAAYTNRRIFYLGPWNRTREVEALDWFTPLHEYGHLLGLGDTYQTAGLNEWKGQQPPSVMNGESMSLTDDDRLGLWATLRQVKTGVRGCEGTKEAQYTINGYGSILCNAKSEPIVTHGDRGNDQQIFAPPTGPIPESTLRETQDYTVASLQLNCRAGAGTEHAVITKLNQGTALRSAGRIGYSTEGRPWLLVSVNGTTCYASASLSFITPQGPIPMSTINEISDYAVSTQRLNCREGAGTEYGVVQELPLGTKMTIEGSERVRYSIDGNPWIHVRANGLSCFSSANFKFLVPQIF
ncbi:MAG: SH3 domain-containing protein [Labilithrix sp.]